MSFIGASDAAKWSDGKLYGPDIRLCRSWKNDSRDVGPGDAFVALKGEETDGHLFVHKAIERGAKFLLINSSRFEELSLNAPEYGGITVITVTETESALAKIAAEYLKFYAPEMIGITGSVGKTTTRELTLNLLQSAKKVHSAIRSFNTVIGCSLTILAMPEDTEILILEFGTNHFGEIREMVDLFPPETAVITEVAPAHLEGFGTIEGVLKAKMEICESRKLKTIIFNYDNKLLRNELSYKFNNIQKIGVGKESGSDLRIIDSDLSLSGEGATLVSEYDFNGTKFKLKTNLFGLQHAFNVGYAFLAADLFGVGQDNIEKNLSLFSAISGRGRCKKLPRNLWIIDEAYNANPSSMRAAIENTLNVACSSELSAYAVLGGMRELGASSLHWHQEILAITSLFQRILLLGDEWFDPEIEVPCNAERYKSFEEITPLAENFLKPDSVILVKGSNSYGLKRLVALVTEG
ncbi:MAG: UDP-N-acetylmuramoyl-tripeptide--D-alanyl-D-alanine ligase [Synergistaceae bacterium]|nr:UDP-N-acetylmuramoyl-tripeptide--D-alanyl-D-alanine ligase [Synergistaceae bacterium]